MNYNSFFGLSDTSGRTDKRGATEVYGYIRNTHTHTIYNITCQVHIIHI